MTDFPGDTAGGHGQAEGTAESRYRAAYEAAMALLVRREHSRLELRRKLAQRGHGFDAAEQALDELAEAGLQSDRRFAEQYASYRAARRKGRARILADLGQRGITGSLAHEAVDQLDTDWAAMARQVIEGMGLGPDYHSQKVRQTIYRRMHSRGFSGEDIRLALAQLEAD